MAPPKLPPELRKRRVDFNLRPVDRKMLALLMEQEGSTSRSETLKRLIKLYLIRMERIGPLLAKEVAPTSLAKLQ